MRLCSLVAFTALVIAGSAAPALGQSQAINGTIEGTVKDAQGGVLAGVSVTVTHLDTNTSRVVQTNEAGVFRAPLLPLGTFSVAFNLSGFAKHQQTGITLAAGQTVVLNVALSISTLQENVLVTSDTAPVDLGKTEAVLPIQEQIPRETYRRGDRVKALLLEVRRTPKDVQVILTRSHPQFVSKLFELEVPEVMEKIVEIKAVVREPGDRTKIAVTSREKAVDPVGACVGIKGSRVQAVVRELRGEKIDIITWTSDPRVFIAEALNQR